MRNLHLCCTDNVDGHVYSCYSLRPRQNGRHFPDDPFKCIFLNENVRISIDIPLKFVSTVPIDNIRALVQIMAWRRPGDKPLSEPMMVRLLMHICVTRPQWVKWMAQDFTNDKSTLVQVMTWCRQAIRHYPSQYWLRLMTHMVTLGYSETILCVLNLTRKGKTIIP